MYVECLQVLLWLAFAWWGLFVLIATPQSSFIAAHGWEMVGRKNLTIFKVCHYRWFYMMISSRFRKVKAKNVNSDPCIIIFLVPYFNFPRTFPHRETGFELRLFWFWIKRLNAFSMSLAHKYVNLKDHQDIKEQVSTKSFLKKNTGSTWNPQPRGIVWIRCFPNSIRYL